MSLQYLSLEEILRLHFQVIKGFGGSHGVRDEGRLKSVIDAPRQEAFGQEQYITIYDKAAVYLRNIIGDHLFSDGNKRTALVVCGIFLRRNGKNLVANPMGLENFIVKVATKHLSVADIALWLENHTN